MIRAAFVIPGDIDLPTGGYTYDRRVLARIEAHGIDMRHVALPGSFPAPAAADIDETARLLSALPDDTVLLIDGLAYGAMPARLVAGIRQPIVNLCHHPLALEAGLPPERQAELKASEQAALAFARHVVVPSPATRAILVADYAVPALRITVAEPGTERAARATGTGAPLHLVAVGALIPRKGYDVLVSALASLTHLDWTLSVAGPDDRDPRTTAALKAQIAGAGLEGRIRFLGAADQPALDALYASADIFVMPSLFEGYGMVLTEAMARGLPIVCTTGGAAADTAPGTAAIKVPPGDPAAFGAALARLIADAGLRRQMSDASWAAATTLPTWDDTARTIAGVLQKVRG